MSEKTNVRLVRCPKCENLLPEATDSSVYQCGGCGAVLKVDLSAKNKGVDLDTFSEKSEVEKTQTSKDKFSDRYEQIMNVSERRMTDPNDGSESDVRSTISSTPGRANRHRPISRNRPKAAHDFDDFEIYNESNNGSRNAERNELDGFRRAQRFEPEVMRYCKAGPSSLVSKFGYDYGQPARNEDGYIGEDDRADLLKKLNELTDQLSRSGNLADKGKEKAHPHRQSGWQDPYASDGWYSDASSEMNNRVPMRNHRDPPYTMHRQEMGCDGFHPSWYAPNHAPTYGRGPQQAPMPYHALPPHGYKFGPYMDDGMIYMDAMDPYPPNFSSHHHHHHHHPSNFSDNLSRFGSRDYNNPRFFPDPCPLKHLNVQSSHARWPSDGTLEADNFIRSHWATRARLASSGKKCHPIAGGPPFLSCYNCFELILLPKRIRTKSNGKRNKISCGSCSTVIVFTVSYNKLLVSSDVEPKDNNNYLKADKSMSTHTSDVEKDNISSTVDVLKDKKGPRPPVGSSLQDHFEHSNIYRRADHSEERNISLQSEKHEKVIIPNKNEAIKQILRNGSSATEIDLSSNEYSNTGTTFDSGETSIEGDQLKASNAAKLFFGGIGFNDSNRSDENLESEKANVTVNGHLIAARLVKKAEKLAGPIQPGNYWYDFRAGFWGVIGGPCLGIIPPFIEEFKYSMPEHCAGGNTHVFINGRELNQKDLYLLGNRGLPTERDRSYIVEISGRVLDEDTGEELESLGKLAPTVERVKHGFGMRPPKPVS